MDRRWIVFPTIAATAAAQVPVVAPAEKALRARASEFYQLQVDKKYRQAESLIAADSKDEYYDSSKPKMESYKLQKVDFAPDGKSARVTALVKVTVLMMGAGVQKFEAPTVSSWKLEHGKWCWYFDKQLHSLTPFGKAKPGGEATDPSGPFTGFPVGSPKAEDFQKGLQADKASLILIPGGPSQDLTITNSTPATVQIRMANRATPIGGLTVTPASMEVAKGGKGVLKFSAAQGAQFDTFIDLAVEPFARTITVKISTPK